MNYKAIIFDMDGTIVDTDSIWDQATKRLIESKGVQLTPALTQELHHKIKGLSTHLSCQVIKDMTCIEDPVENLIREKGRIAHELYKQGIKFIPGFEEFHKKVLLKNLKTGVATNADDLTLKTTDEVLQLRRFFGEHLYNISCVGMVCKPDPALYIHAALKLEVDPRDCIAIEDSPHGIRAAKRAGMKCIGINTGKDRSVLHEADLIVEGYDEIDLGIWS
jgi:HAD superfamily hydrolase (TIGR01509 family)